MEKKLFQKMVKSLRKEGEEFPKAMMFGSQIRKRTATINCGRRNKSNEIAKRVVGSEEFIEFVEENNVRYKLERKLDRFENITSQIRLFY